MYLIKNSAKMVATIGLVSALSAWAQPPAIPSTPAAVCEAEPSGARMTDTVVSSPDDSGYYNLFNGTMKGWWNSCLTGHSKGSPLGAQFRIGSANGTPAIYSAQTDGQVGGVLMTNKKFTNYEIVFDFWPDFGNDGGLFNRTTAEGKCYQTVLDYLNGGSVGGVWGEGGYTGRDIRPWTYEGSENSISIKAEDAYWTISTSKLNPTSFGCPKTGCTETEYKTLWDPNGWNQMKVQFYGSYKAGTGNVHMKSWFRKVGATPWVPILMDTVLPTITPPGYIGFQVHVGDRFNGAAGNWYKNIKWRPVSDQGDIINNHVVTSSIQPVKFNPDLKLEGNRIEGIMESDYEVIIKDVNGKSVESFQGKAGKVNYTLTSTATGWLSVQIKSAKGIQSTRMMRAKK